MTVKQTFKNRDCWAIALLLLFTVAAYLPVIKAGFVWDDDQHVSGNQAVTSAAGVKDIWLRPEASPQYYPLVQTVFWLEHRFWGLDPLGYHLVNLALHALNALLVFCLLRRLSVPFPWLGAAVFALHPVQVESVAWVSELKNLLSGFFYLAALLAYLDYDDPAKGRSGGRFPVYILSFFLFVCALLSKTITASLPVAISVILWWKRPRLSLKDAVPLVPMLAAGTGMGLVTVWLEKNHVQAFGAEWSLGFIERVLVAGRALWFYLAKLAWPFHLTFIYPRWQVEANDPTQYIYPAAFLVMFYLIRHKAGKGLLAGAGFFVISLIPALGFFNVYPFRYSYVADHFQYLASLGIVSGVAGIAGWLANRASQQVRKAVIAAVAVMLSVFGVLTFRQSMIYRDTETLWRDTISKNPGCWMAYNNLGIYYLQQGEEEKAEACFLKAVSIDSSKADQRNNLGLLHLSRGLLPEALGDYKEAVRLDPNDSRTHYNLGLVYLQMDSLPQAEGALKKAVLVNSGHAKARCNLGLIYLRQKKYNMAEQELKLARALNPELYQADYYLAKCRSQRGDLSGAEALLLRVLQKRSDFPDAEYDLIQIFLKTGRTSRAQAGLRSLRERHPEFFETENNNSQQ
jgi:Tfp pilus assembly protein PilF